MTIFPNGSPSALFSKESLRRTATAGLKTPADSQPAPWGERIGVSDARCHAPNGEFAAGAARASDTATKKSVRNILCLRKCILRNSLLRSITWFCRLSRLGGRGWRLGRLRALELRGANNSFALLHHDQLVGLHVFQRVHAAARPANFEQLNLLRFSNAEVHAQVILRNVAAAAAHLINLLMRLRFPGQVGHAAQTRANSAAIRFCANGFYLQPIIFKTRIAAQQLGKIIVSVHDHVDVTIVVEIAERRAARRDRRHDPRAALRGHIFKMPVAQIAVENFLLRISRFGPQLLDFGIDVAVANQYVRPAVVVHVEKAAAPAEELRVLAEPGGKRGVLEISAADV